MAPDPQSLRPKTCLSCWSCLCTGRMWGRTHEYRRLVWNCAYQLLLPESIYDWKLVKDRTIVSVPVPNRLIEATWHRARNSMIIGSWDPRFPIWFIAWPSTHRRTAAPRLGWINSCVWKRGIPYDTMGYCKSRIIGSILRAFSFSDSYFFLETTCGTPAYTIWQRFNARKESKIPYSGANTSTGRKSSRDSWKSVRWTGALRPTLLG